MIILLLSAFALTSNANEIYFYNDYTKLKIVN